MGIFGGAGGFIVLVAIATSILVYVLLKRRRKRRLSHARLDGGRELLRFIYRQWEVGS